MILKIEQITQSKAPIIDSCILLLRYTVEIVLEKHLLPFLHIGSKNVWISYVHMLHMVHYTIQMYLRLCQRTKMHMNFIAANSAAYIGYLA